MDECRALGDIHYRIVRHKEVIVHKGGSVSDLDEEIAEIVVVDILCHAGALCLPVKPGAESTVVNVIVLNYYVNSRVELDATYLVGEKFVLYGDIVDLVMLNF